MRIRHYGLLANCHRDQKLARSRELLGIIALPAQPANLADTRNAPDNDQQTPPETVRAACPVCGQLMRVTEIIAVQKRDTS
jgi:hypothetical protein